MPMNGWWRMADSDLAEIFSQEEEVEITVEEPVDPLKVALEEIEAKFGVGVEVKNNSKYAVIKVIEWLKKNFIFRYNVITSGYEFKNVKAERFQGLMDRDFFNLLIAADMANLKISKDKLKTLIKSEFVSEPFNPFEDFIYNLPKWDGETNHIADYIAQVRLADENIRDRFELYFTKWFVGYVGSLLHDKVVNHHCLVLVGGQGRFKTTFLNGLVPEDMQEDYLYSNRFDFSNKDHLKYLGQTMLINLDEMSGYHSSDINDLKSVLTDRHIKLRLPFGEFDTKMYRRASFVGNSNDKNILKDETGSRRFLVFEIEDIEYISGINVKPLYAQAFALFNQGYEYWFDKVGINGIEENNDQFRDVKIEEELVNKYLRVPTADRVELKLCSFDVPTVINALLVEKSGNKINVNETTKRRLITIMRNLGFKTIMKRIDGYKSPVRVIAYDVADNAEYRNNDSATDLMSEPPI